MTVESFDINAQKENLVSVSDAAAKHFQSQLGRSTAAGVRLSLKQAGCTGYKYILDEVESALDADLDIQLENGVHLYIDSKYLGAIKGTQIDVRKQGLNTNLIMENPNVVDECGCGESFSIENFEQ